MIRIWALCLCMLLASGARALAAEGGGDGRAAAPSSVSEEKAAAAGEAGGSGTREMSGMSIVGNDEAPTSLTIVPWKSSEIGAGASLNTMLSEDDVPVDRDVFRRQLEFYRVSTSK